MTTKAGLRLFCLPKGQGVVVTTNSIGRALNAINGMPVPLGDGYQLTLKVRSFRKTLFFTVKKEAMPSRAPEPDPV